MVKATPTSRRLIERGTVARVVYSRFFPDGRHSLIPRSFPQGLRAGLDIALFRIRH